MKLQVFDGPGLVAGAQEWFGTLDHWPSIPPHRMAGALIRAKHVNKTEVTDTPYFGIQAALLMLVKAHNNEWPPMTPQAFAADLHRVEDQILRYAKNIILAEATSPRKDGTQDDRP